MGELGKMLKTSELEMLKMGDLCELVELKMGELGKLGELKMGELGEYYGFGNVGNVLNHSVYLLKMSDKVLKSSKFILYFMRVSQSK